MQASRLRFGFVGIAAMLAVGLMSACGGDNKSETPQETVRLNQIQMIASHNSYHVEPPRAILDTLQSVIDSDRAKWGQYEKYVKGAEYSQPLLAQQFDSGVRNIEIDVYADSKGGLFTNRAAAKFLNLPASEGMDELQAPGFKVMHLPDIDYDSTCWTLKICLSQVAAWSAANPGHLPLVIDIEAKDDPVPDPLNLGFVIPEKIGRAQLDALDAEILSVFKRSDIITPDDVRGSHKTLEEAALNGGWPAIESARGKVMFLLVDTAGKRAAYREGNTSLEGRVMFTESEKGSPDAAVLYVEDPTNEVARIGDLVRKGYMVRVMADADTIEPRAGITARRDAAIASGAHLIATDFLEPRPAIGGGYRVAFPGGTYVRCNPLSATAACEEVLTGEGE